MERISPVIEDRNEDQTVYKHALVCEVILNNGNRTKAFVIFNNDELNFEEINIGMNFALARCDIHKSINTFCGIKNGNLKPCAFFHEKVYNK